MFRWMSPIFLLACAGESVIDKQENSAPTVLIVSHSDGVEVQEGYEESFRATVSDDDDEFSELQIVWYVGEEIVCDWVEVSPAGDSTCQIAFGAGDSNVIVEARDPQGSGGRAEISVSVLPTEAPVVELLTPESGQAYYSNQLIQFSGVVSDNEDAIEDLVITWTSSIDGELVLDTTPDSTGVISDYTYLTEGQHAIELRVEDSSNKVSSAEVVVQVGGENNIPACAIIEPASQSAVAYGDPVIFMGTAIDDNIPSTDLVVEWVSDKDGTLGASTPSSSGEINFAYSGLSLDIHTISLNVMDEIGALCSEQILLTVGNPPTAVITAPSDGDILAVGEPVIFQADVSDQEDSPNEISVEWVSSLDGTIHSSVANSQGVAQFSTSSLAAGLHSISLTATDTSGLMADDLITIRINTPPTAPTLTLSPDPVYSMDSLIATASGSVDGDGDNISYLYEWYENGILTTQTSAMVSASELDVGEVWTVRVIPNDGWMDGDYTEASITITNSDPVVSGVTISPSANIYNDSTLSCSAIATDADGAVTPIYQWYLPSGLAFGSSIDLTNFLIEPGDTIECMVAVNDGFTLVTDTASVLVENRAPVVTSATITSSDASGLAYYDSTLTCSLSVSEPDNEIPIESYQWETGGVIVGSSSELDLTTISILPGDTLECTGTATDGSGETASSSTSVTVENTVPIINSLGISPAWPELEDVVTCSASAADPEGESLSYNFVLTNQTTNVVYTPTSTNTTEVTLDLNTVSVSSDDVFVCDVTVTDARGDTSSAQTSTIVANTAPIFTSEAEITPNTGVMVDVDLECESVATDPDGVASLTYTWQVNGSQVATGPTWTVDTASASVGDEISCTAIAIDTAGNSSNSMSDPVPVENSPPEVDSISLNTLSPDTATQLEATITSSDLDGDSVSLELEWHVVDTSGADTIALVTTGQSPILPDSFFARDEEVYVVVTPFDGTDYGVAVSSVPSAIVLNTAPTQPTAVLSSLANPPLEGIDDLTCSVTGISTDLDGDAITYSYAWTDDLGAPMQTTLNTSATSDVFSGSSTTSGTWTCTVTASDGTDSSLSSADQILVDTDWAGAITFTNCGKLGRDAPSQSQCNTEYAGTDLDGLVTVSGSYQYWTVVDAGTYSIEVAGAQGGSSGSYAGGEGAVMIGEFTLSSGDELEILVGQRGGDSTGTTTSGNSGGGGGGTFVALNSTPLIVAGGGGGAGVFNTCSSYTNLIPGLPGQSTQLGVPGQGASCVNHAISAGQGGGGDFCSTGASMGAGYYGDSPDYSSSSWATGADAFVNGGIGALQRTNGGDGGFGGGGGGAYGGGGGGGYSGGGTGDYDGPCRDQGGGGGGSYNSGSNPVNSSGGNTGFGYVIIDKL